MHALVVVDTIFNEILKVNVRSRPGPILSWRLIMK